MPSYRLSGPALVAVALLAGCLVGTRPTQALAAQAAAAPARPALMGQLLRQPGPQVRTASRVHIAATTPTTAPTSTWTVRYDAGFRARPQARASFQAAVDIWSRLVASKVPITVDAISTGLDPGVLGEAGPTGFVTLARDGTGGTAKTAFPRALANAIAGRDLTPGSDITAEFDTTATDVYYGTDGQTQGKYDFETVVLHELAHGLGFLGSMSVDGAGKGSWGPGAPTIYDRFTVRSGGAIQGKRLLSYANGSAALGDALTTADIYWDGPLGKAGYNGRSPRLYTPRTWEPASSYSHVSATDFPAADPNSLMTPFIGTDQVKRDPGPAIEGMFADLGWTVPALPGLRYSPVDPVRILDTRNGTGGISGRLDAGRPADVVVVGGATGVPLTAAAVVLSVTGVDPSTPVDLRVYPTPRTGTAQPPVSNLSVAAGATRSNLVTVPVGDGGRVRFLATGGAPHALADVQGWYGADGGSALELTDPVRLLDTRDGTGGVATAQVQAGGWLDVAVTGGLRQVPASASAVLLSVTALNAQVPTALRAYPTPTDSTAPPPDVTNLSVRETQTVTGLVLAKVGADGKVRLLNDAAPVDLFVDLLGWYDAESGGALFHVLGPQRILDTRTQAVKRFAPDESRDVALAGVAGVPAAGATAAAVNVAGVDPLEATDLTVFPTPVDRSSPIGATVSLDQHETGSDQALTGIGQDGGVRLRNGPGEVAVIVDVSGWFGP